MKIRNLDVIVPGDYLAMQFCHAPNTCYEATWRGAREGVGY